MKDEYGNRRFFGIYRGVIRDVSDPENLGRIRAVVPQIFLEELTGWFWVADELGLKAKSPKVGQGILVQFEGGDPSFPLGVGFFGAETNPSIIDCGVIA